MVVSIGHARLFHRGYAVAQRNIIGTFGNRKAIRTFETLLKLLSTWKQRGINTSTALDDALGTTWAKS